MWGFSLSICLPLALSLSISLPIPPSLSISLSLSLPLSLPLSLSLSVLLSHVSPSLAQSCGWVRYGSPRNLRMCSLLLHQTPLAVQDWSRCQADEPVKDKVTYWDQAMVMCPTCQCILHSIFFIKTQNVILHASSSNASHIRTKPSCADSCAVRRETITPNMYRIQHPQTLQIMRGKGTTARSKVNLFPVFLLKPYFNPQVKLRINVMHFDLWNAIARGTRWRCEPVTAWNSAPMSSRLPLYSASTRYTVNLVLEEDERTFSNGC